MFGFSGGKFSNKIWGNDVVHFVINQYNVFFVVLFPNITKDMHPNQQFWYNLLDNAVPVWLITVYSSPEIKIYKVCNN